MSRAELDTAIGWARAEGWNPGLYEADSFYATDPNGYFIGEADGQPVGCISAVAYDSLYGFMGFYIVRPEHRGSGHGLRIWNTAMNYLGDRTIGADGVPSMLAKYETFGFRIAYRNLRYGGLGGGKEPEGLAGLDAVSFADIVDYDTSHVPAPRTTFLRHWVQQRGAVVRIALDGARVVGFGMLRVCKDAYKVGPLFADSSDIAATIFAALRANAPGAAIFLDTPEPNTAAVTLAKSHGMTPAFETSRIYRGPAPDLPLDRIFGVTSFELG
jgi:GNAT superfamily N-acetyltransferase